MYRKISYFILLNILVFLTSCSLFEPISQHVIKAEKGTMELKNWNFGEDGVIRLNGDWEFYWQKRLNLQEKDKQYITVPSTWTSKKDLPGYGYATYRLVIDHLEKNSEYALVIPSVSTSYDLWIDGVLVASAGKPSVNKETTIPYYLPQKVYFSTMSTKAEIVMQVSNFHYRDGGIWESIYFGTAKQIEDREIDILAYQMIILGCLLLSGLYHVVLFILRRQNRAVLFFSLVCFIVCIRILVTDKIMLINFFPEIPWSMIVRLEYLTYYTSVPLFCWVLHTIYPNYISNKFCKFFTILSIVFSLQVLFTEIPTFTKYIVIFQVFTLLGIIYVTFGLIKALKDKQEGALIVNVCAAFLSLTVINDILSLYSIIQTYRLSSLGLFVFIFSQSYIIANRSAKAFSEMERVSNELALLNITLEEKVIERTKSLERSKEELEKINVQLKSWSFQDQLTQIPNRRYFDEVFDQEWGLATQNKSPLAVIYFDIDHFKLYNDSYGHEAGDECLRQVATTLRENLIKFNGFVARMGGEEFVAILSDVDEASLQEICEACRKNIHSLKIPHEASPLEKEVTVSVGAALVVPNEKVKGRELINAADESLYEAKEKGRNQVYINLI